MSDIVSIVAVHGLGGHWERTWTHENGTNWLQDILPAQIPRARIMKFGYNANTAFSKSVEGVDDVALMLISRVEIKRQQLEERRRPLIFIGHSLGGIIVKKARLLLLSLTGTSDR
jgi:alpha-beta hydrolase superfamily lysophospholipase